MARFYQCSECEKEFLGSDDIPDHEDGVEPICELCGYVYVCGFCGDTFRPLIFKTINGGIFTDNADYCPPCYARECVSVEEEIEQQGIL